MAVAAAVGVVAYEERERIKSIAQQSFADLRRGWQDLQAVFEGRMPQRTESPIPMSSSQSARSTESQTAYEEGRHLRHRRGQSTERTVIFERTDDGSGDEGNAEMYDSESTLINGAEVALTRQRDDVPSVTEASVPRPFDHGAHDTPSESESECVVVKSDQSWSEVDSDALA